MAAENAVADDDPERCQGTFGRGIQCHLRREPNSVYCKGCAHASNGAGLQVARAVSLYRLRKYQSRVQEFENHPKVQTLAEEVAILRMTLEAVLNECDGDDKMLILFSGKVLETVNKIRETILAAHKLQSAMGQLLSKNQIIQLGERMVAIISSHVTDPQAIEQIGEEVMKAIDDSGNPMINNRGDQ